MTSKEIKLMIIENFIDHFTTNEAESFMMKMKAGTYVEEDHVDEIKQVYTIKHLKDQLLADIKAMVEKQPNGYIQVNDTLVNVINDQESEVIQSVTFKTLEGKCQDEQNEYLIAWYGLYEETDYIVIEDCSVEMITKILKAVEKTIVENKPRNTLTKN